MCDVWSAFPSSGGANIREKAASGGVSQKMDRMDQAWAALLGTGLGVAGTLCTSGLTYASARRQAHDQGLVAHGRALRGERREAYLAFMQVAEPVDDVLHRIAHQDGVPASARDTPPAVEVLDAAVQELGSAVFALYQAQARLDLMRPEPVAEDAVNVWSDERSLRAHLEGVLHGVREGLPDDGYRTGLEDAVDAVERSREKFTRSAREVITAPP